MKVFSLPSLAAPLVGAAVISTAQAQSPFEESTTVLAGLALVVSPSTVDLNGDGILDVVMISVGSEFAVTALFGLGGGDLAAPIQLDPGQQNLNGYDIGDVDGDGDLDVLVGRSVQGLPLRLVLSSPGGFTGTDLVLSGGGYSTAKLADLNGDGAPDLITSRSNGSQREFFWFDNAGGTFSGAPQFITSSLADVIEAHDFDGDGFMDVATPAPDFTLRISFGLGAGAFAPASPLPGPAGNALFPMSFKDIDGDGLVDLFPARGGGLTYLRATAPRVYAPAVPLVTNLDSQNWTFFLDLDVDGDTDLIHLTTNPLSPATVTAVEQVSPGVFGPATPTAAALPQGAAIGDLNGDGRDDILHDAVIGLQWQPGGLSAANGYFGAVRTANAAVSSVTTHELVDLDSDGDVDILVGSESDRTLGWIENLGSGELANVALLRASRYGALVIRAVDFEGDGDLDIVYITKSGNTAELEVLLNDGAETFTPLGAPVALPPSTLGHAEVKDFDGDGLFDVLVTRRIGAPDRTLADLLLGAPGGGFTAPVNVVDGGLNATVIRTADLNGDGLPDIVHDSVASIQRVVVSLNLGGGVFAPPVAQITLPISGIVSVVLEDFDSDGLTDVMLKGFTDSPVLHRGNGTATLEPPITLTAANVDGPLDLADVDGDGDFDLFTAAGSGNAAFVYLEQLPGGSFAVPAPLFPDDDSNFESVLLGDLDGDGDPEAIVRRSFFSDIEVEIYDNTTLDAIGQGFCDGQTANSTGVAGTLTAFGSELVSLNQVELQGAQLPTSQFAMLLGSRTFGSPMPLAGSPGLLCLTGGIGRYQGPGQIMNSGPAGALTFELDLSALSLPNGPVMGIPGETWSFQAWHRDTLAGTATSQLTTGVALTLR